MVIEVLDLIGDYTGYRYFVVQDKNQDIASFTYQDDLDNFLSARKLSLFSESTKKRTVPTRAETIVKTRIYKRAALRA